MRTNKNNTDLFSADYPVTYYDNITQSDVSKGQLSVNQLNTTAIFANRADAKHLRVSTTIKIFLLACALFVSVFIAAIALSTANEISRITENIGILLILSSYAIFGIALVRFLIHLFVFIRQNFRKSDDPNVNVISNVSSLSKKLFTLGVSQDELKANVVVSTEQKTPNTIAEGIMDTTVEDFKLKMKIIIGVTAFCLPLKFFVLGGNTNILVLKIVPIATFAACFIYGIKSFITSKDNRILSVIIALLPVPLNIIFNLL